MSASVFPARAGMSRTTHAGDSIEESVPRASGDEPSVVVNVFTVTWCSPRERG